jgi:hypothetical protein
VNGNAAVLRVRLLNRCVDLMCDSAVVALLLVAVRTNVLPKEMGVATIGFALRALVHPSLSLGVFTRTWPADQEIHSS